MSPKDKAIKLVDRFINVEYLIDFQGMTLELAKQCSLIAGDEILRLGKKLPLETLEYYLEVKQEIEKIC